MEKIDRIRSELASKIPVYRLPEGIQTRLARVTDQDALWLIPENANNERLILFLHGGGYIAGSIHTHRELAGRIAQAARSRCLLPEYRLAPENPFPTAIEDCIAVYRWLTMQEYSPQNIIFVGDSAGGGLVAALLIWLRDSGIPLPSKAVLMAPWVDLTRHGTNGKEKLSTMANAYLNTTNPHLPVVSPLYAKLHRLPPMMVQISDGEPFYRQAIDFSRRVQAAGGLVLLDVWNGLPHLWQYFSSVFQPGIEAIERIGTFIRKSDIAPAFSNTSAGPFRGALLPDGGRSAGTDGAA